jgi:hypothetical protein
VYDYSEYSMLYNRDHRPNSREEQQLLIRESTSRDTEELVELSIISFEESEEDARSYLGHIASSDNRIQHIGLLEYKVAESLRVFPDYIIELEVMTGNQGALSIYTRAGFEVKACYDYFRIAAEEI